jgi:hypothetical protein
MYESRMEFMGTDRDEHGMPLPYFCYQILAEDTRRRGNGVAAVASVLVVAGDTLPEHNFPVSTGSPEDAAKVARDFLRALPRHARLVVVG